MTAQSRLKQEKRHDILHTGFITRKRETHIMRRAAGKNPRALIVTPEIRAIILKPVH